MTPAAAPALERAAADPEALRRALQELGRRPEVPVPGLADYVGALVERALHRLGDMFGLTLDALPLGAIARGLAAAVLLAAVGTAVWLLVRRLRRGRAAAGDAPAAETAVEARGAAWDAAEWSAELERRLAAGDARGALSALWWWLARRVAAERARPTWTSQELMRQAGRGDLLPIAIAVDRLAYGPRAPQPDDVARLFDRCQGAVA